MRHGKIQTDTWHKKIIHGMNEKVERSKGTKQKC
jgi:hypothetical protein